MATVIIYSTKYGTTKAIAEKIKNEVKTDIDILHVSKVKKDTLNKYDTVIIGGSIYIGSIQRELRNFMFIYENQLLTKNLGLFICAGGEEPSILENELINSFPIELWKKSFYRGILGYSISINKLNFIDKIIVKNVKHIINDILEINNDEINYLIRKIREKEHN